MYYRIFAASIFFSLLVGKVFAVFCKIAELTLPIGQFALVGTVSGLFLYFTLASICEAIIKKKD